MKLEIKVPELPESVSEGTLMTWHKKVGDVVQIDDNLVDIETDKVVLEVVATESGTLTQVLKNEGDTVLSNELLAVVETDAAVAGTPSEPLPAAESPPSSAAEALSPAVAKMISENNLTASDIKGTGKDGRLTKADVVGFMDAQQAAASAKPAPAASPKTTAPAAPKPAPVVPSASATGREEQRVPMTRIRQRIAERLLEAQRAAAILTTFNEISMKPVMDLRSRHKEEFEKTHGARLGFMSFFVKAAVDALQKFPAVNAYVDGTDILYHNYCDIGIAVSSPRGLVVPIIRNAEQLNSAEIETTIAGYGKRARDNKLTMEELTGGTFSISNGGVFGSMMSTPILNPPQSAILGMHNIVQRPVVENGEIVIRPMMYLALSYDHRIVDGKDAVQFLVAIKNALEDPARLLLNL